MTDEPNAQAAGEPDPHEGEDLTDLDRMSAEELMREMARQLAERPVRDFVMQTMATFADLAGIRLGFGPEGPARRDLTQARLAIETLRALVAVTENEVGAAQARPFREPLAQLQMLYARAAEEAASAKGAAEDAQEPQPDSGLWTPGGGAPAGGSGGDSGLWTPGG